MISLGVNIIYNGDGHGYLFLMVSQLCIFPTTRGQPWVSLIKTQHNVEEELGLYELRDLDARGDDDVDVEFNEQILILSSFAKPWRTSESPIIAEVSPVKDLFLFKVAISDFGQVIS